MLFMGIDPGLHGAVAWIDGERREVHVQDCPLVDGEYNYRDMWGLLLKVIGLEVPPPHVTMEKVHALPTDGRCSAFSFGVGYGAWLAILGAMGRTPQLVSPQTWKRTMMAGIANDKKAEAAALKQRFQGHEVCSQLHGPRGGLRDGRVDALWLAEYGRVTYKLGGPRHA